MLGLVNGQVSEVIPISPDLDQVTVEVGAPNSRGLGRIYAKFDGQQLRSGIRYHRIVGEPDLSTVDAVTGEYRIEKGATAIVRVVIHDQCREVQITG